MRASSSAIVETPPTACDTESEWAPLGAVPAGEFFGRGDDVVWTGGLSRTGGGDGAVLADEATDAVLAVLPPKLGTGHGPC